MEKSLQAQWYHVMDVEAVNPRFGYYEKWLQSPALSLGACWSILYNISETSILCYALDLNKSTHNCPLPCYDEAVEKYPKEEQ